MVIKRKKLIFRLYYTLVCLTYILSVNIVPPFIQWMSNKLLIFSLFFLSGLVLSESKYRLKSYFTLPLLLLLLYSTLSWPAIFLNFNNSEALKIFFTSSFLYFLLFITLAYISRYFTVEELFKPFITSSLIILFLSVSVYLGFEPTFYFDDEEELERYLTLKFGGILIGFSGVYLNQNTFGMILIVAIATMFSAITAGGYRKKATYIIIVCGLIIAIVFLILTFSRASILSTSIIFTLYLVKKYKSKLSIYIVAITTLVLLMTYIYFYDSIIFLTDRVEADGSSGRTEIWSDALNIFYNNPWFGVGHYKYISASGNELSAHNAYLNKLASEGIFSTVFWFFWLTYGLWFSIKNYFKSNNKTSIIIAASFFSILIHQFFENTISNVYSILTLFLMLVYTLNINKVNKKT